MLEMITGLFLLFFLVNVIYPLRRFGFTRWRAVVLVLVMGAVMGAIEQGSMTDEERAVAEQKQETEREAKRVAKEEKREAKRVAKEQKREAKRVAKEQKREAKRVAKEQKREAERVAKAEEKRKGFHCLSSWDGSHRGVVKDVEDQLNDPDSFDHDETRVTPVSAEGTHTLSMKFRANNAFGALMRGQAVAVYQNEGCDHVLISCCN